jgi:translocation and assembly module TamB
LKRFLIIAAALIFATFATAQTEDDDKGFLTRQLENSLSGAGREVNIVGFAGALSSEATIAEMTIADTEGVWLTLRDVVMTWNRLALVRGAVDVRQLRAAEMVVARAPIGEPNTGPSPEAQPFSLPELPVRVAVDALQIDRISLGPDFLGEPLDFSLTGSASLAGGEGAVDITATRLDGPTGVFTIAGSYANATRVLDVLLLFEEDDNGIAANLLGLPGRPSVRLEVAGNAPLDDFAATFALATAGEDRLTGDFTLASQDGGSRATLDISGDVSPLFEPAYQVFFGDDASLRVEVITGADGSVSVPVLALDAGRVTLDGQLRLGAGGWPELIDLEGGITPLGNQPVLLPLAGPPTFVDGLDIDVAYDVAVSDDWRADIRLGGFARPGLSIADIGISGGGLIRPAQAGAVPAFTAELNYAAQGLRLDDAGAQEALGDEISGVLVAAREGGGVTEISQLTVDGAGLRLAANATIAGADAGFAIEAEIAAAIDGLARFSTLAGREIGGGAEVDIGVIATPLEGTFDVTIDGQTRDLAIGIPEADRLLEGQGDIALQIVRDAAGTRLESLTVATAAAQVEASADLTSNGADATFAAQLAELALVVPDLAGPASVSGDVSRSADGVVGFDVVANVPETEVTATGTMETAGAPVIRAAITADAQNLSRFATIAGIPLSGAVNLQAEGEVQTEGMLFDVTLDTRTSDLAIGQARVDPFLAGPGRIAGTFRRTGPEAFGFSGLSVTTNAARIAGSADLNLSGSNSADLRVTVNDAGLLDPSLSGPIRASVVAAPLPDDATRAVVSLNGPETSLSADVVVAGPDQGREITGSIDAEIARLAAFAGLAGRDIAGSIDLTASGSVMPDLSRLETQVNLRSEDLRLGIPAVDPLLAGTGRINADIALIDGVLGVRTLEVSTREVSIVAALNGAQGFGQGRFNASLRDVGVLTDQISGPVRATGSASLDALGNWGIDATGTGPGGLSAAVVGTYNADGTLDLDVDGSAPLALANAAIDPRRLSGQANFDLAVNGPPALTSLSGRVTFTDGRLAAPTLGQALTDIGGAINIAAGRAQIDLFSGVEAGGSLAINGGVGLTAGNQADLAVTLENVVFRDPDLYRTSVNGRITINGPLAGGARIAGTLDLGQTDVQVPSSSVSSLGALPDVTHVGASAEVRQTLARAGLLEQEAAGATSGGRPFPLDLTINAPSRIFVRGRGLDAELGGSLRIGGTTADVMPVGQFSLIRGRIDILQQRFDLSEGSASLQGSFEPFLRLVANTTSSTGTVISIIVEGPASAPEVRFESVPQLPQDEVLAQLIFGRDLQSISALQAVQLAAAINTLAGRGGDGALSRLRSDIGLDDFDVTTDAEGNAAVRAGAYLSENVYTDVTINTVGDTEINLNLDITSEITAKGSLDQDGRTSVGVFFERDY